MISFLLELVLGRHVRHLLKDLQKDYCPRIYLGFNCKNNKCDHGYREWSMLGIDKDELREQPYVPESND